MNAWRTLDRNMLTNSYLIALGIPLILVFCGALAKKLVRGTFWQASDFFLGVELALASLGSALIHFFDLQRQTATQSVTSASLGNSVAATASYVAIAFFLLLWILSTHQDWVSRTQNQKGQLIWLGGVSNIIGVVLFAAFIMLVKGV